MQVNFYIQLYFYFLNTGIIVNTDINNNNYASNRYNNKLEK